VQAFLLERKWIANVSVYKPDVSMPFLINKLSIMAMGFRAETLTHAFNKHELSPALNVLYILSLYILPLFYVFLCISFILSLIRLQHVNNCELYQLCA